ncbi:MAG TPA: hypothetical protein VK534_00105 [Methylomirabilota bacterium]|nr:hypothetical protein [Methylomirabilota bacterium]
MMFNFNKAPKSDRHYAEDDMEYAMRKSVGFSKPDVVVMSHDAAPIMPPELIMALKSLQAVEDRALEAEAAQPKINL